MKDAIAKYPDSVLLKQTLIQYYEDNGNYDVALAETDNYLKKDSTNIDFLDKKAQLHLLKGDTLSTIKCLEKIVDIFPEPAFIISLGAIYAESKNPKALQIADALLIGNKANADKEAIFIKGLYYSSIGEKNKALNYFDECLKLDYTYMDAYLEKGAALYDLKKYNDALLVFNRAVTIENGYDIGHYWMGKCFEKLNKPTEAIESYKTALLYNKDLIEARDALGKLGIK
ncbi:MAG: tetratricopeptide repeat protein [Chitinophagaceae bacterium]|nr:tetratricopeptide repeat protein [Chitinophagaceae bacterium]